jgi:hypothetical protein
LLHLRTLRSRCGGSTPGRLSAAWCQASDPGLGGILDAMTESDKTHVDRDSGAASVQDNARGGPDDVVYRACPYLIASAGTWRGCARPVLAARSPSGATPRRA